jgi:glycosyltransferase involved in cell wall biosynthesis
MADDNIKVCVLFPVRNAEATVQEVLESILSQTYEDFKVLIIDDASTDKTPEILAGFKDKRIEILRFKERIGRINALNWSLSEVNEPYIVRADASTVSMPERIAKLVEFMDANPEVGICGCCNVDQDTKDVVTTHEEIVAQLLFDNPIQRGSIIIRTELLEEKGFRLRDIFRYMEDYDLWYRLMRITRFANLNMPLIKKIASHSKSTGYAWYKKYRSEATTFYLEKLLQFGLKPSDRELKLHLDLATLEHIEKFSSPVFYKEWMEKLKARNKEIKLFPEREFTKYLDKKWSDILVQLEKKGRIKKISRYLKLEGKSQLDIFIYILKFRLRQIFPF